jgi:hypothetical protein
MKKGLIILIFCFYLLSTIGFSMAIHKCGNKVSASIFGLNINKHCNCDHENENHDNDCCNEKNLIVKADKSDKSTAKILIAKFNAAKFLFNLPISITSIVAVNSFTTIVFNAEFPPGHSPPLFLLDRAFLI